MLLKSYSKINIGLKIINKRDDGFHNIETIYYPINYFDEIDFNIKKNSKTHNSVFLKSNKTYLPNDKTNNCYKAVSLFFKNFNICDCYDIEISVDKSIPVGGGLGGGSSNAASILKALIKFFNIDINLHRKKILDTALLIGSDVPFFLVSKPCFAQGRGEILKILPDFKIDYRVLLINPNIHVSTKWAYESLHFENRAGESNLSQVDNFDLTKFDFSNDFENVVFKKYQTLKDIKKYLIRNKAKFASMSGSGATMYAFFDRLDKRPMYRCYNEFKKLKYSVVLI
jgi:4-diphosphocytidyl-2-C-methyl-D-erythritol kinase